jgi:pilus assembly protein Flp/PilA
MNKILKGEHEMFNLVKTYLKALPKAKKGQAMVEYGLIIALIAIVVIVALTLVGTNLRTTFNNIAANVLH